MSQQIGDLEVEVILRKTERRVNAKAILYSNYRRRPSTFFILLATIGVYYFLDKLPIPPLLVGLLVCLVSVVLEVSRELYIVHKKLNAAIELLQLQEMANSDISK
ncbi:hypothetical protein ACO0K9_20385 [Undibacterium sp. Ji50W]|uniref:hypothetical protein n=1 Tax=Undibacterium sp. Ji50W TaxID=3413041 RepID=UPI003BF267AC